MKKKFLINMLSEGSEISHKRVITFAAFILLGISFLLDLFFNIEVSPALMNIMEAIVFTGFGATTIEKFANKNLLLLRSQQTNYILLSLS